jgi:hypothetical protein
MEKNMKMINNSRQKYAHPLLIYMAAITEKKNLLMPDTFSLEIPQ